VKTVAVLCGVIGVALLGLVHETSSPEIEMIAVGSATASGIVDGILACQRCIRPIYLLDVTAGAVLVLLWLLFGLRGLRFAQGISPLPPQPAPLFPP
jgi:hypothetical protein